MAEESRIAVFVDFENLAIGSRDMHGGEFRIDLVQKRLLEKGRIVFKRAYCDWNRYRGAVRDFHAQGIEMIDIPSSRMSGKNSADIRMVVDALDLCHSKGHIDIFALLTGDSDFSPLVNKLKENNKRVIGCGVKSSTSDLLVASCDEFLYYDDLVRSADNIRRNRSSGGRPSRASVPAPRQDSPSGSRTAPRQDQAEPTATVDAATLENPAAQETAGAVEETGKPKRKSRSRRSTKSKPAAASEQAAAVEGEASLVVDEVAPVEAEATAEAEAAAEDGAGKPKRKSTKKAPAKRTRARRGAADADAQPEAEAEPEPEQKPDLQSEGLDMLLAIVTSLSQDYDPVWGSLAKQTLHRVHPDFREERYGYPGFNDMLKDAEKRGYVTLEYDQGRGNYKIRVKA